MILHFKLPLNPLFKYMTFMCQHHMDLIKCVAMEGLGCKVRDNKSVTSEVILAVLYPLSS